MQATNICYRDAANIPALPEKDALISINDTGAPPMKLQLDRNTSKVLTVFFDDVTENAKFGNRTVEVISGQTAMAIVRFVQSFKAKNFIVHCAAGISRSAAVCMYIHLTCGHKLKPNFWHLSHPNPYVLGKLLLLHSQLLEPQEES